MLILTVDESIIFLSKL